MSLMIWNVRGMGRTPTHNALKKLVREHEVAIAGLVETKLSLQTIDEVVNKILPGWNHIHNFEICHGGRIVVAWNPTRLEMDNFVLSDQSITMNARCLTTRREFDMSIIYAYNRYADRRSLWQHLVSLFHSNPLPWILGGDFNCVRFEGERNSSTQNTGTREMHDTCSILGVEDTDSTGCFYTWSNGAYSSK